jgi:chromate reductase, NAD(P)H dehydrogenase (quinone)
MTTNKKKILAISGSTRNNSSNEKILNTIARLYSKDLDVEIYNQIGTLPHFNPDFENKKTPVNVIGFRNLIEQADGVLICTPEYVFSLPGSLKNALEWTVSTTVFSDKPTAFIVASASGEKAFESLDLIMSTLIQTQIPDNSKFLIKGVKGKVSETGDILDSVLLNQIKKVVNSLIDTIEHSKLV